MIKNLPIGKKKTLIRDLYNKKKGGHKEESRKDVYIYIFLCCYSYCFCCCHNLKGIEHISIINHAIITNE